MTNANTNNTWLDEGFAFTKGAPRYTPGSSLSGGMTNFIDVTKAPYNAKGDGVTNDTVAINSAITALPASGGTVFIPSGTYMIAVGNPYTDAPNDGSIRLKSNVTICMDTNTTLKVITNSLQNYALFNVKGNITNVVIEGGMLVGDRTTHTGDTSETSQQGMGIWLEGCSNIRILNVSTKDFWGDGIYTKYHNTYGNCKNIYISGYYSYNNRRQGISLCAVDRCVVTNSTIDNTNGITAASSGIDIEPELSGTVTNVSITNCTFTNNRNGMSVQGATWGTISDCVFTSNVQYGLRMAQPAQYFTVSNNVFKGNTINGIYMNFATDNIISNNVIQGSGSHGIHVQNNCNKNTVSSNRCIGNTGMGIYVENCDNMVITSNHCNLNALTGIQVESSDYVQTDSNQAYNNTNHGVYLYDCNFSKATSNLCSQNGQHGIRITDCEDSQITNNVCTQNSQTTSLASDNIFISGVTLNCFVMGNTARKGALVKLPRYGVRIDVSTVNGTLFKHNDLRGGGQTGDSSDLGTGTVLT